MKRILSMLLCIAMLSLWGCGGEGEQPAGDPMNPIAAGFAEAEMEVDHAFIAEASEYTSYILFTAGDNLSDVRVNALEINDEGYAIGDELYAAERLQVGETLLAGVVFYGDLTTYGISFADSNGAYRSFAVFTSGKDGSLLMQEFVP